MKHIEQIQPEYAADDMTALLLSDATATAALTRLLHDWTGCDIPQTDTTPQSDVDELVPLAVSILRRHWTTPLTALGDGTTPMSLADLMRRLIGDRVQGNEAWCIPPVHDNIPAAVAALARRKLTGLPELPDGLSFARIFCDSTIPPITELIDDNIGWVMDKAFSGFPKLKKLTILGSGTMSLNWFTGMSDLEELIAPNLSAYSHVHAGSDVATMPAGVSNLANLNKLDLRGLGDAFVYGNGNQYGAVIAGCPSLKEVWLGRVNGTNTHNSWGETKYYIQYCPALEKLSVETMSARNCLVRSGQNEFLLHLEIRGTQNESCNLNWWNPTDKGSLFLSNFRLYIADRLSDNGSGKTLTLSQEVRDAIHSAGIDTIITNKGWTISPVPTQQ